MRPARAACPLRIAATLVPPPHSEKAKHVAFVCVVLTFSSHGDPDGRAIMYDEKHLPQSQCVLTRDMFEELSMWYYYDRHRRGVVKDASASLLKNPCNNSLFGTLRQSVVNIKLMQAWVQKSGGVPEQSVWNERLSDAPRITSHFDDLRRRTCKHSEREIITNAAEALLSMCANAKRFRP